MKRFLDIFLKLIAILLILGFSLTVILFLPGYSAEKVEIIIKHGMGAKDVAKLLTEKKVIPNPYLFRIAIRIYGKEKDIKAGKYIFQKDMPLIDIINKLVKGKGVLEVVTIPEGLTSSQIAEIFYKKGIIKDKERFLKIVKEKGLEGYLFPDTYYISENYDEEKVIDMMIKRFKEKLPKNFSEKTKALGLSEKKVITLASLVEKEAKYPDDRPKIASVFLNRLKKGMKLESCATIQYILGTPKPNLTYKDLKIESPYNTYLHKGLPPTPICNPGEASIIAVLNPEKTDYFYFVADKDGHHLFAKTYKEHLKNKKKVKSK